MGGATGSLAGGGARLGPSGAASALFWVCLLLAPRAGGAPPETPEKKPAPENTSPWEGKIVKKIAILRPRGPKHFQEAEIKKLLRTREGAPFHQEVWDEDYRRLGRTKRFFDRERMEPEPYQNGVKLTLRLTEVPQIGKLSFRGNARFSDEELLKHVRSRDLNQLDVPYEKPEGRLRLQGLREGLTEEEGKAAPGYFNEGEIKDDVRRLLAFYKDKGHDQVRLSEKVRALEVGPDGLPLRLHVIFDIAEGYRIVIREVKLEGCRSLLPATILAELETRPGLGLWLFQNEVQEEVLKRDLARIGMIYKKHGFNDVEVTVKPILPSKEVYGDFPLDPRPRFQEAAVVFMIEEGPLTKIRHLRIEGNKIMKEAEILAVMESKPGGPFSKQLLRFDAQEIRGKYGERGRIGTKVNLQDRAAGTAGPPGDLHYLRDVTLTIEEGPEVTIERIITRGNTYTDYKVIVMTLAPLRAGSRLDQKEMDEARDRLQNTGFFEQVEIVPLSTEDPEKYDLYVHLTEQRTGRLVFGAGFSSLETISVNVALRQDNFDLADLPQSWEDFAAGGAFRGGGQQLELRARGGRISEDYQLSFADPYFLDTPLRLSFSLYQTLFRLENYSKRRTGCSLDLGKWLWGYTLHGSLGWSFEKVDLFNVDSDASRAVQRYAGSGYLGTYNAQLRYTTVDFPLFPTTGTRITPSVRFGTHLAGSDFEFYRLELGAEKFFTVLETGEGFRWVLQLEGRAGRAYRYGQTAEVPLFERYFLGGVDSLRGFDLRTISPRVNGEAVGGRMFYRATAELTFPIPGTWRGAPPGEIFRQPRRGKRSYAPWWQREILRGSLFFDAGTVDLPPEADLLPGEITRGEGVVRWAYGLGLFLHVPIAPVPFKFYYTLGLEQYKDDQTRLFQFTIDTIF